MKWFDIAKQSDFPNNTVQIISVEGTKIAVFNLENEFHAIEDNCTHECKDLASGSVNEGQVTCPWHGARFDIRTGEALSAPAYEPVETFRTRIENGMVQVAWSDD